MTSVSYTPGHSQNATNFMAKRSFQSHSEFFKAHLSPNMSVLDCGCGPGSITLGIAELVAPGRVIGVDFGTSQVTRAKADAESAGRQNVSFQNADCYSLPFKASSFDRIFSHALLEHLSDPVQALREWHRVLKPGGIIGVCSPDWGGFVLAPPSPELSRAIDAYTSLQARNGGDGGVGRKLGTYLALAGFQGVRMSARYECYPSLEFIGEYLAAQLEREGDLQAADVLRTWSKSEGGMFAQAWVAATAQR